MVDYNEEAVDNYLEHFGVKGMKWGVRKERDRVQTARQPRPKMSNYNKRKNMRRALRVGLGAGLVAVTVASLIHDNRQVRMREARYAARRMQYLREMDAFKQARKLRYSNIAGIHKGFEVTPSGVASRIGSGYVRPPKVRFRAGRGFVETLHSNVGR